MKLFENLKIPVSKKAVDYGLELGKKVYLDKLDIKDKTDRGSLNNLQADIYGFIAESVVCEFFNQPFPAFTKGELDEFDIKLKGLKIDVKKVSYSSTTKVPKIIINKRQFFRKYDKIDAFLFCTFKGNFESIEAGPSKMQVWIPTPVFGSLDLLGYAMKEDIEKNSKIHVWKKRDGSPLDEGLIVDEKVLKDSRELIE